MRIWKCMMALGLLIGASYATPSNATPLRCGYCSSKALLRQHLEALPNGDYIVFSLRYNLIARYKVAWPPGEIPAVVGYRNGSNRAGPVITELSVPTGAREELFIYRKYYTANGESLRATITIPATDTGLVGPGDDAYDVLQDRNLRRNIGRKLADEDFFRSQVGGDIANSWAEVEVLAGTYLGLRDEMSYTIRLVMEDGSSLYFILRPGEPEAEYNEDSASTPNGQFIPDDREDALGTWYGAGTEGGDDMARFVNYLQIFNIPIHRSGQGSIKGVICSGTGDKKVCTITIIQR